MKKEIWIIDDHQLFAAGMKQLLHSLEDSFEIRSFKHPKDAAPLTNAANVSLIITDFYIPHCDILVWLECFSKDYPSAPKVVISSSVSSTDKVKSLEAGALVYIPKHTPPEITIKQLIEILDGKAINEQPLKASENALENLTEKQSEILIQLTRGHSNKRIASLLGVSPETVKTHLASIYKIIACDNRDDAIAWARDRGLA